MSYDISRLYVMLHQPSLHEMAHQRKDDERDSGVALHGQRLVCLSRSSATYKITHTDTHTYQSREYKGEGTKFGRSPILHRHAEQAVRARINIAAGKAGQGMLPGLLKSMSLTPTPRQAAGCCALPSAAVSSTSGHGDSAAHAASPTHAASSAHASAWGSRASARPRSS